jgi:hypothetical protein
MQDQDASIDELYTQGHGFLTAGEHHRAADIFKSVLTLNPMHGPATAGLGLALLFMQSFADAVSLLECAVSNSTKDLLVLEALGIAYVHTGRNAEAEEILRRALRFGRNSPETLTNLAAALIENGKFDEAEAMLRNCLRKTPEHLQAQHNLSLLHLLNGKFEQGWPGFELRNSAANRMLPIWAQRCPAPIWNGEPLKDRSILLYCEQGLGDTIQFARYARELGAQGACVTIQCQAALVDTLGTIKNVTRVISTNDEAMDVDYKSSLLSVPGILKTTIRDIPSTTPYVLAARTELDHWSKTLGNLSNKPKVGLVWSGNPDNKTDHKRSMSLNHLAPIFNLQDIHVVSLQIGAAAGQIDNLPALQRPHVLFPEMKPLSEVAAIISNLHLLISVDTALAHLAGALNKQVWTLISHVPDWRWMLNRGDTPWYPSMRLFRQPAPGDWNAVVMEVVEALKKQELD